MDDFLSRLRQNQGLRLNWGDMTAQSLTPPGYSGNYQQPPPVWATNGGTATTSYSQQSDPWTVQPGTGQAGAKPGSPGWGGSVDYAAPESARPGRPTADATMPVAYNAGGDTARFELNGRLQEGAYARAQRKARDMVEAGQATDYQHALEYQLANMASDFRRKDAGVQWGGDAYGGLGYDPGQFVDNAYGEKYDPNKVYRTGGAAATGGARPDAGPLPGNYAAGYRSPGAAAATSVPPTTGTLPTTATAPKADDPLRIGAFQGGSYDENTVRGWVAKWKDGDTSAEWVLRQIGLLGDGNVDVYGLTGSGQAEINAVNQWAKARGLSLYQGQAAPNPGNRAGWDAFWQAQQAAPTSTPPATTPNTAPATNSNSKEGDVSIPVPPMGSGAAAGAQQAGDTLAQQQGNTAGGNNPGYNLFLGQDKAARMAALMQSLGLGTPMRQGGVYGQAVGGAASQLLDPWMQTQGMLGGNVADNYANLINKFAGFFNQGGGGMGAIANDASAAARAATTDPRFSGLLDPEMIAMLKGFQQLASTPMNPWLQRAYGNLQDNSVGDYYNKVIQAAQSGGDPASFRYLPFIQNNPLYKFLTGAQ